MPFVICPLALWPHKKSRLAEQLVAVALIFNKPHVKLPVKRMYELPLEGDQFTGLHAADRSVMFVTVAVVVVELDCHHHASQEQLVECQFVDGSIKVAIPDAVDVH